MIVLAASTVTAAACSSGTSSGSAAVSGPQTPAAVPACMQRASAFLKSWDTPATSLSADYPRLPGPPPAHGTIVRMTGPLPTEQQSTDAMIAAAKTIGWTGEAVQFDGSVEDLNQKLEQEIAQKPAIIVESGFPVSSIARPVQEARAAGVIIVAADIADTPTTYPGFSAVMASGPTYQTEGEINAYEFMLQSDCHGQAAIFDLPYPILKVGADAFTATVDKQCPACKVSYTLVQASDVNTPAATQAVVSKLQSDPSVKYLMFTYGDLSLGVASALQQAGISGIKIFGDAPNTTDIAALRSGQNAWWIDESPVLQGWMSLYVGLRALETRKPVPDTSQYPLGLLTPANVGGGTGTPVIPENYQALFEKLWYADGASS
jgi:ABC-type sugar transport system substrate-binding protein